MEGTDERLVKDVASRDPGPLFKPIALPVHQVVITPTSPSGAEQPPDSEGQRPIDQSVRRRNAQNLTILKS